MDQGFGVSAQGFDGLGPIAGAKDVVSFAVRNFGVSGHSN